MINALLVIFDSVPTWDRIAVARRRIPGILAGYLVPILVFVSAVEGYSLWRFGKARGDLSRVQGMPLQHVIAFEISQFVLSLLTVFIAAKLIKALGETFHGRHTFVEAFTVAAYGLGPLFILRIFNALPPVSPWLTWGVGIVLCISTLYHGLPRVMRPDPPHAFGLYLVTSILLILITGLACFLTAWYLDGRFGRLNELFSQAG
ncbi:MAG: Yip1 family protein [Verrucomicrobiota bacterium]